MDKILKFQILDEDGVELVNYSNQLHPLIESQLWMLAHHKLAREGDQAPLDLEDSEWWRRMLQILVMAMQAGLQAMLLQYSKQLVKQSLKQINSALKL